MCQKIMCFFVFGLLLPPVKGNSQKIWTLDNCIAYALEHNLTQETQNYDAIISKERWRQSKRDMLPTINVSYPSYNVSFGRTLDPVTNSFVETRFVSGISGGLSSSITLFESFKKWHTLTYQKLIYKSSQYDVQQAQYDLVFKIMDLFNQVVFHEGALKIVKEQQVSNILQHKTISKKVDLQLLAKADLYDMEATVSADALAVLRAENTLKASKLALIQEMNLNVDTINIVQEITEDTPSFKNASFATDQLFRTSNDILPSLQISKLNVEQAKKRLAITKTALFPTIRLGAGLNTRYSVNLKDAFGTTIPFKDQIKNNQSKYYGLSFSFPVFNNGRIRSNIKISKIDLEKAQIQLEIEEQHIYKIIQELLQKNEALIAEEQLNLKNVRAKEKAYNIAKKKYEKQLINLYELQLASSTYLAAKIEQIRLTVQIAIQKRTLNFYNGTFLLPTKGITN
ncbi:TolC family protein [Tamlana sp. 2201CG12-4]|uniref:TolC family protein n=1 Tax=Tamlana sp. 2201CG12-4 TaxID=3112582 RepID=UPI002DB7A203|nr:TolC family protein [Tamlana sp. 2201CG12-4]MEC3907018.1 TolC family protein [Tamlana sp. 2201CG12-4]